MSATVSLTLKAVTDNFKSEMKDSVRALGDFKQAIGTLSNSGIAVRNLGLSFGEMARAISAGNVKGSIGGAAESLSNFAVAIPTVATGVRSLATLLPALAGPGIAVAAAIGAIIVATGAMKIAWEKDFLGIRGITNDVVNAITGAWGKALKWISDLVAGTVRTVSAQLYGIKGFFTGDMGGAAQQWAAFNESSPFKDIGATVSSGASAAFDGLSAAWKEGTGVFKDLLSGVIDLGGAVKSTAMDFGESKGLTPMTVMADSAIDDLTRTEMGKALERSIEAASSMGARIDGYAKDAGDRVRERVMKASDSLADPITGSATLLGEAYNAAFDAFGPVVAEGFLASATTVGSAVKNFGSSFGSTMAAASGAVGSVVDSVMAGFQSGGVAGAMGAAIGELVSRSGAFAELVTFSEETLASVVESFESLAQALKPLAALAIKMVGAIANQLGPLFEKLTPVFHALFQVVRAVFLGLAYVVKGIGSAWNGIIGAIASVFEKLGAVSVFGKHPLGFLNDWAGGIRKAQINMAGLDDTIQMLKDTTVASTEGLGKEAAAEKVQQEPPGTDIIKRLVDEIAYVSRYGNKEGEKNREIESTVDSARKAAVSLGDAGVMSNVDNLSARLLALIVNVEKAGESFADSAKTVSESAQEIGESLLNVPAGFKVVQARYNAMNAEIAGDAFGRTGIEAPITVGTVVVQANNPDELAQAMRELSRRENYVRTGSIRFAMATPYGAGRTGAR